MEVGEEGMGVLQPGRGGTPGAVETSVGFVVVWNIMKAELIKNHFKKPLNKVFHCEEVYQCDHRQMGGRDRWHLVFLSQNMGWEWLEMPFAPCDLFCWFWHNIWSLFYPGAKRFNVVKGCPAPAQDKVRIWISIWLPVANEFYFVTLFYFDFFTCKPILPLLMYPFTPF